MQAQSAAGNDAEALRTYERCRQLLAEELGSYPSAETEAIYRRLLDPRPAAATSVVEAPPSAASPVGFETARASSTLSGDRGFRRRDRAARRRRHPRRRNHGWIRSALGRAELDRRPRPIRLDRGDRSRRRAADRDHVGRGRTVGRESRRPDRDTGRRVVTTSRASHRSRRPTDRARRDGRHGMGGRRQRQRLEDRPEVRPAGRHTPTRGDHRLLRGNGSTGAHSVRVGLDRKSCRGRPAPEPRLRARRGHGRCRKPPDRDRSGRGILVGHERQRRHGDPYRPADAGDEDDPRR